MKEVCSDVLVALKRASGEVKAEQRVKREPGEESPAGVQYLPDSLQRGQPPVPPGRAGCVPRVSNIVSNRSHH